MKKKIIIPIIIAVCLIGIIIGFIALKDKSLSKVTLDINPSIELLVNKKETVTKVKSLNEDGKEMITKDLNGKPLIEVLEKITQLVIEKGYPKDNYLVILLHTEGNINQEKINGTLIKHFEDSNIHTEVIVIESITKEDQKLAKKYNISPAKAAYINQMLKENKELKIEDIVEKPIRELKETKETGKYCKEGYSLQGDFCYKKIGEEKAQNGLVCPQETSDYEGKCYKEDRIIETDNLTCREEFTLENNKCYRIQTVEKEPNYNCTTGELMRKSDLFLEGDTPGKEDMLCVDKSSGQPPTLRCLTHNHTMINGKCANGPKPTINGGCEAGDYLVNGGCYDIDNEDQWVCPDGRIYEKSKGTYPELCPDTFTFTTPTITGYTCPKDFKLKDNNCVHEEQEDPQRERTCNENYTLKNDRCLDLSKEYNKVEGLVCEKENGRVENNKCILYEIIEVEH